MGRRREGERERWKTGREGERKGGRKREKGEGRGGGEMEDGRRNMHIKKGRELRHDLSSPRSANAGSQPQALTPSSILIPPRFCVEQIWKERKKFLAKY